MRTMPDYYERLHKAFEGRQPDVDRLIWMDVERTCSTLTAASKKTLHRVLSSFAKRNPEVSYCQGMNFLANYFLKVGFEEESVFWILCFIVEQLLPVNYYINLIPVFVDIELIREMLMLLSPELVAFLDKHSFDLNFVLVQPLVTQFTMANNPKVDSSAVPRVLRLLLRRWRSFPVQVRAGVVFAVPRAADEDKGPQGVHQLFPAAAFQL